MVALKVATDELRATLASTPIGLQNDPWGVRIISLFINIFGS